MASAVLTLLVGALVLLCFYLYLKYTHWKRNGIPTAKGFYPLVGHMLPLLTVKENFGELVRRIYNENGSNSMVGIYKGVTPVLMIREPNLVKAVLQSNFSSFHENGLKIQPDVDPLLALNPFFVYGDVWSKGRKRLTYAFSSMRLKVLFEAVNGVCKKLENFLSKRHTSNKTFEVELKYLFSKFTGEVVANAGLGIEGLCFEDKVHPNAFDQVARTIFKPTTLEGLITQLIVMFPNINRLLKIRFTTKELDQFFRRIVTENLELRRNEPTPRNDFLQLMIDLERTGEKVDETLITAHAFSFYVDGFETSSLTLAFVGFQLASHPDIQEKLRNEVKSVIAKHGGVLTYEGMKEMTYMDQVISESQRRYAALGFMSKICTEEFEFQGSDGLTCRVKPGDEIVIPVSGLHLDPNYWVDPEVFDPERFSEEGKQTIKKMTFLPFGEGPRMCVGMRMALLQMKTGLATLLRNYKLELSPKTQLPLKLSPSYFLATASGGLWVHLTKV